MQIKKIKCAKNMKTKSIPLFHLTFFYPMSSITSGPYTGYSKKVMFKVFPRYKSSLHILLHPKDQATIMASQPIPPKVPPPEIKALWSGLMKTHWFSLSRAALLKPYFWGGGGLVTGGIYVDQPWLFASSFIYFPTGIGASHLLRQVLWLVNSPE